MKLVLRIDAQDDGEPQSPVPIGAAVTSEADIAKLERVLEQELLTLAPEMGNYGAVEISVSLLSPDEIRSVNNEYRQCDEPTDVLSFPMWESDGRFMPNLMLSEADSEIALPLGDIIICPQEVKRLHPELSESSAFCLMLAHSFLHLLAWDHDTDEKQEAMWECQNVIRDKLLAALQDTQKAQEGI